MMKVFKAELLKLKRSKIILITTMLTLLAIYQGWDFARVAKEEMEVFKSFLYQGTMTVYSWLIFPLIITIVIAMMARIEHSNNSWKHLLALPVKRGAVYVSKLIISIGIILYSLLLLYVGMVLSALTLPIDSIPFMWMAERFFMIFLSSLPIVGVIFYVSYRFTHFGAPLAIGVGLAFPSMLIANSEKYWIFYPWDYPIISSLSHVFEMGGKGMSMLGISFFIFSICYFDRIYPFSNKGYFVDAYGMRGNDENMTLEGITEKKILLVDDEVDILHLLETVLRKEGFQQIYKATTGQEAMDLCARYSPNIIVLDIMLPDIEGYEVCKKMRESDLCTDHFFISKIR